MENLVIGQKNNDVQIAIVDKGSDKGAATRKMKVKHYVNGKVSDENTQVSLNDAAKGDFRVVGSRFITEIPRYNKGKWTF